MILRLKLIDHVRAPRLRRPKYVRARPVILAVGRKWCRCLLHFDTDVAHRVDEFCRRREVWLVDRNHVRTRIATRRVLEDRIVLRHRHARPTATEEPRIRIGRRRGSSGSTTATATSTRGSNWCTAHRGIGARHVFVADGPVISTAAGDLIRAHAVNVEQELILVARREIENGIVGRHRVIDGLPEVPRLRRDRRRQVAARQHLTKHDGNLGRRGAADDFRQNADDVLEVRRRAQSTVPPGRVAGPRTHGEARLVLLQKALMHRRANHVEPHDDHGIEVVVERIAERRRENHRAGRTGLMMIVHDLRQPLPVHEFVHVLRLGQIRHVEIAIVVVSCILLVQPR